MAHSAGSDAKCRSAIRHSGSARSDSDRHRQYRAAIWYRLCSRRSEDSDTGELRDLLRSHSAARDLQRVATRWLEVSDRAIVSDTNWRSRVSQRPRRSTRNTPDETKHHAYRSEHRDQL